MWRILGRCVLVSAYWAIVVLFLRAASPVFMDGGGPMPSFGWGRMPLPTLAEYSNRNGYYDSLYLLPYLLAGLVATVIGCGAVPVFLKRLKRFPSHPFLRASGATLALLLLVALLSDVGVKLGLWEGPLFLLHAHFDFFCIFALSKALLPASILSGVVELAKRRASRSAGDPALSL